MALLDIINQRKKARATPVTDAGDVTQQMRTMQTGKVGSAQSGPAQSNVASQMAADSVNAAGAKQDMSQLVTQTGLAGAASNQAEQFQTAQAGQSQALAGAQQDFAAQTQMSDSQRAAQEDATLSKLASNQSNASAQLSNTYANALADMASQRGITEQDIFSKSQMDQKSLDSEKFQSHLAQVAHVTALSDKKYVDAMQRIGQERNLRDDLAFEKEAMRLEFGNDYEILNQQFNMQELMNMDERAFKDEMANMDINTALSMAAQAAKEQQYMDMIKGGTMVAKEAVDYNMNKDSKEGDKPTSAFTGVD